MNTPERNYVTAAIGWDFTHDGIGSNFPAVKITAASARCLHLVSSSILGGAYIDVGADSASRAAGLTIDVDNAGTSNLVVGIDLSSFAANEPLFKVPVDTNATAGTLSGQFPVLMGTTTYYANLYTHG